MNRQRWTKLLLVIGLLILAGLIGGYGLVTAASVEGDATVSIHAFAPQAQSQLEGVEWTLVSYVTEDGETKEALEGAPVTMTLEDGKASGSAGCNRYFASYEVDGDKITFGETAMTRMLCPDMVMEQEQAFSKALARVTNFAIENNQLTLLDADGNPVLVFTTQAGDMAAGELKPSLVGPVWQWQGSTFSNDTEIKVDDPAKYTVTFGEDGSVTVMADCKSATGQFTDEDGILTIELGPTTLQVCSEGSLADEFLKELGSVAGYVFDGERLVLNMKADAGNLYFLPAEAGEAPESGQPSEQPTEGAMDVGPLKPFVGEYKVIVPPSGEDQEVLVVTLNLNVDGTLNLTIQDLVSGEGVTMEGAWEVKDDAVYATVTPEDGEPKTFTMRVNDNGDLIVEGEDFVLTHIDASIPLHKQIPVPVDLTHKAYVSVDLQAGNPLDPFLVSVNGGGTLNAAALGGECSGYVNLEPVARFTWEGEADFVRFFFYSDHDPTLIVQGPDGEFYCNDDANFILLDPSITLENPKPGAYNVWVGSYYPDQLLPGILVATTRDDVRVETFTLNGLVKRGPMPDVTQAPGGRAVQDVLDAIKRMKKGVKTLKPGKALTARVTADGAVPAFEFKIEGQICNGYIKESPDLVFDWSGKSEQLNVFFEGNADSTLLVVTPDGKVLCNDDSAEGRNINPLVTITSPAKGRYAVFVGHVVADQAVKGTLTVTDKADAQPEVLEKAP